MSWTDLQQVDAKGAMAPAVGVASFMFTQNGTVYCISKGEIRMQRNMSVPQGAFRIKFDQAKVVPQYPKGHIVIPFVPFLSVDKKKCGSKNRPGKVGQRIIVMLDDSLSSISRIQIVVAEENKTIINSVDFIEREVAIIAEEIKKEQMY